MFVAHERPNAALIGLEAVGKSNPTYKITSRAKERNVTTTVCVRVFVRTCVRAYACIHVYTHVYKHSSRGIYNYILAEQLSYILLINDATQ